MGERRRARGEIFEIFLRTSDIRSHGLKEVSIRDLRTSTPAELVEFLKLFI